MVGRCRGTRSPIYRLLYPTSYCMFPYCPLKWGQSTFAATPLCRHLASKALVSVICCLYSASADLHHPTRTLQIQDGRFLLRLLATQSHRNINSSQLFTFVKYTFQLRSKVSIQISSFSFIFLSFCICFPSISD